MTDVSPDVIVLEADGLIDDRHGYAHHILNRLGEYDYHPLVIKLAQAPGQLATLPRLPIIISGGMTEVTANEPWVVTAREFVASVMAANRAASPEAHQPLLGICFGAQLIAETHSPGSVTYLEPPDVPVTTVYADDPQHPLFAGLAQPFQSYTFHYNQINSDDLRVLARRRGHKSGFIEAFEIPGAAAYGVQFHPEFTDAGYRRLIATYAALLASMGEDVDALQRTLPVLNHQGAILHNFLTMA